MKTFISLCMIVKDEEKVLERCLTSVKDCIDEIIIVDTGSKDKSVEISKKYTNKVFDFVWKDDFSEARNFAASKANGEWILVLDADEYVEPENLKETIRKLKNNEERYEMYTVNIINFIGEQGESTAQHKHTRIYKNNKTIKFSRSIHEQLVQNSADFKGMAESNLTVYHSGYLKNVVTEKDKNNRNQLLLDKVWQSDRNAFDEFNYGNEYRLRGELESALNSYINAFNNKKDFSLEWVPFCVCNLVECLIELKKFDEALQVIKDAEKVYCNTADFIYLKGIIYFTQGRHDDSKEVFEDIISHSDTFTNVIKSYDYLNYLPNKRLGMFNKLEGNYENAIVNYINALNFNQYCIESATQIISILSKNHSEIDIYEFISKNFALKNKKFLNKIMIFLLNEGFTEVSELMMENYYHDPIWRYTIQMKLNIINKKYEKNYENTIDTSAILFGIHTGIIHFTDLAILYLHTQKSNENKTIEVILKNSELNFIIDLELENKNSSTNGNSITEIFINKEIYTYFIDKCIKFKELKILTLLIKFKSNVIDVECVDSLIARILFRHELYEEAIGFYELADEEYLVEEDYLNIINWLLNEMNFEEAFRINSNAIKKFNNDFRFIKHMILIEDELGLEINEESIYKYFEKFPNSKWLMNKYLEI
ncbi:glycosyltransferase [Exiguobacterium acetylicum]|uniref:glycosyltransferase n=1 Tax=Exiguobacterium acetylicum TaxID=41170 RepID=UPI0034D55FCF